MICDAVKVHAPRLANKRVEAQAIMCVPRLADFDWAHGCRHDLQESACQKYTNTEIGKHAKSLKSSPWSCCGADLSGLVCVWLCLLVLRMNQYWGVGARAPRAGRRQQNRRNMTGRTFLRHVCTWTFLFCLWVCAYVGFCFLLWCCAYVDFLIVQFLLYSSIPTQVVIGCLLLWCHLRTSAGQGTALQRDNRAKARRRPHKGTIGRPHKRG